MRDYLDCSLLNIPCTRLPDFHYPSSFSSCYSYNPKITVQTFFFPSRPNATVLRNLSDFFSVSLPSVVSILLSRSGRIETDLSGPGWTLRLDRAARWIDEELFIQTDMYGRPAGSPLPMNIPVNPPTGGWDALGGLEGKNVAVPGTVEEYFWSAAGNPNGNAGDYRGVSWWSRTFTVDPAWGKRILSVRFGESAEDISEPPLVGSDIEDIPVRRDRWRGQFGAKPSRCRVTDPGGFAGATRTSSCGKSYRFLVHGSAGSGRVGRPPHETYSGHSISKNRAPPSVVASFSRLIGAPVIKGGTSPAQ